MAKTMKEVKNNMNIWKPTVKQDEIDGVVEEVKAGEYGNQYLVLDGRLGSIWTPSHKVLQSRLSKVKKGDHVKIIYDGQELPKVKGQNPTSMYKVFVEE